MANFQLIVASSLNSRGKSVTISCVISDFEFRDE
ncbi:hypothetical protein WwAna0684, partial [Wolbachia endosymbiont of Drosophila ananassae]